MQYNPKCIILCVPWQHSYRPKGLSTGDFLTPQKRQVIMQCVCCSDRASYASLVSWTSALSPWRGWAGDSNFITSLNLTSSPAKGRETLCRNVHVPTLG